MIRMEKTVFRTIGSTLVSILVLLGIMLLLFVLVFPSSMMTLTYRLGMDETSCWFAARAYEQSGNVYFIACATETSIGLSDSERISDYGDLLIADEKFENYCTRKDLEQTDSSYLQYIYGQLGVAKYRLGEKEQAEELVFSVNRDKFPPKNAAAAVLLEALKAKDKETVESMYGKMTALKRTALNAEDVSYLEELIKLVDKMRADSSF